MNSCLFLRPVKYDLAHETVLYFVRDISLCPVLLSLTRGMRISTNKSAVILPVNSKCIKVISNVILFMFEVMFRYLKAIRCNTRAASYVSNLFSLALTCKNANLSQLF